MNLKSFVGALAGAVVAVGFAVSSANAAVLPSGGGPFAIDTGDFIPIDILISNGTSLGLSYEFNAGSNPVPTVTISGTLPVAGLLPDLVLSWSTSADTADIIATELFSDGSGSFDTSAVLSVAFAASQTLYLLVQSGAALSNGQLDIQVSAVPIPPALLLFGSALAGVGFLSRKRKKQEPSLL